MAPLNFSTIKQLLQPTGGTDSWMFRNSQDLGALTVTNGQVIRSDTLERNPGFVSPAEVISNGFAPDNSLRFKEESPPATAGIVSDGQQQQICVVSTEGNVVTYVETTEVAGEWGNLTDMQNQLQNQQLLPNEKEAEISAPAAAGAVSSPTCASPSFEQWPGDYNFKVRFQQISHSTKNKHWDVSKK